MSSKKNPTELAKQISEINLNENVKGSVYLIDASSFIFRAYYALAPMSSKGRPSHAVVGFANTLLKLLRDKKPKSCVVVFDSKKPSFRKEFYPEYKANRTSPPPDLSGQITAVREMCELAKLPILQQEGFEADDWIASFVKGFDTKDPVFIVSTDKDLTALIDDRVKLYDAFKNVEIGAEQVVEKWEVSPAQMADYLSMTGDSSDNIPGLPGVGPKTAANLLKEYGSIDNILKNVAKLPEKMRTKISENLEGLKMSRRLVALKEDLEIPFKTLPLLQFPLPSDLRKFLVDWDSVRTLAQFSDELGSAEDAPAPVGTPVTGVKLTAANTEADLQTIEKGIRKAGVMIFDVESDSLERLTARAVGVSVAWNAEEAWYIPLRHADAKLPTKAAQAFLEKIFADEKIHKVAHNLKYDLEVLLHEGIKVAGQLEDSMVQGYLLHADRRSFSLENLSRDFLGKEKGDFKALLKDRKDFSEVPLDEAVQYAAQDAHLTHGLFDLFSQEMAEHKDFSWLYREIEMPLVNTLAAMERAGILLNGKYLKDLSVELHKKIDLLQKEIFKISGGEFNIQSPKQLQEVLFTRLKLTPTKKTKTGFSTDESVLEELAEDHELPKLLLKFRGLSKLTSTYVDVLPEMILPADGRLHTHYHQTGTTTGRLSSSDPNLQNIPIRTEEGIKIREAFEAPKGFVLLSADYSQVELRLFAHMAGDENLIRAFKSERDIHEETAKIIFGSSDKEFRERAKAINYGIIYGISAFGLSKQLSISRSQAAEFMEAYFKSFPRLKSYMEELVALTRKHGYSETLFGRKRPLPDIHSKNPTLRQMAERMAINAPVQGTAADIMKSAMVRIFSKLSGDGAKSRLLLQVHDELVLEVLEAELPKIKKLVQDEMMDLSSTPAKDLKVPLIVDVAVGPNWAKMI